MVEHFTLTITHVPQHGFDQECEYISLFSLLQSLPLNFPVSTLPSDGSASHRFSLGKYLLAVPYLRKASLLPFKPSLFLR